MTISKGILLVVLFFAGMGTSFVYLKLLWHSVEKFVRKNPSILRTLGGFFLRLGLVAAALVLIAKWFSLEGVLSYLLGFFIVKKRAEKYGHHS